MLEQEKEMSVWRATPLCDYKAGNSRPTGLKREIRRVFRSKYKVRVNTGTNAPLGGCKPDCWSRIEAKACRAIPILSYLKTT